MFYDIKVKQHIYTCIIVFDLSRGGDQCLSGDI